VLMLVDVHGAIALPSSSGHDALRRIGLPAVLSSFVPSVTGQGQTNNPNTCISHTVDGTASYCRIIYSIQNRTCSQRDGSFHHTNPYPVLRNGSCHLVTECLRLVYPARTGSPKHGNFIEAQ